MSRSVAHAALAPSLLSSLLLLASGCGPASPPLESPPAADVQQSEESSLNAASLQLALSGLNTCYATALDELGDGDAAAGRARLGTCLAPDVQIGFQFPPAYAGLDFQATGTEAFVQHVLEIFQGNGFVRTQHDVGNVVVMQTGPRTAKMYSHIDGVHVFPDENVLNLTARFVDDVKRQDDGRWLIARRQGVVTSVTRWSAFAP